MLPHLDCFAAVIVGPGPGSPDDPDAVGIIKDLWKVADEKLLPIFGVCLGLQSLGIEFGATLKRLNVVKHGQVSHIHHTGAEIFKGVGDVDAVRYHSLHVELAPGGDIEQLGWSDDGKENGAVVMALKHKTKPFWAVQYHPESACTEGGGEDVIANFWRLAKNWARANERTPLPWDTAAQIAIGPSWPQLGGRQPGVTSPTIARQITTTVLNIYDVTTATICEYLGVSKESTPFVLLDSAAQPGRFTIIGALTPSSPKITYYTKDSFVTVTEGSTPTHRALGTHDIWSWLAAFMRKRKAQGGTAEIPFWGGLVGYLSYELGVEGLSVPSRPEGLQPDTHPDVNLVFVERSIVRDSVTGKTYLQTIIPDDDAWLASTAADLTTLHPPPADADRGPSSTKKPRGTARPKVILPDKSSYISRIKTAKEHLFAGDSYELCVTAPTRIIRDIPSSPSPSWDLYQTLRLKNPAPYSAYLRLHPSTLVASSPERFLSYSRGPGTVCQLRPIKGTLRKGPGVTRAVAETALAGNRKEVAENLMIVDLIRHDLHGVVGEDVQVKKFCGVEESETVWSLVSVIEGRLPAAAAAGAPGLDADGELGWEVLSRSLPPGRWCPVLAHVLLLIDFATQGA